MNAVLLIVTILLCLSTKIVSYSIEIVPGTKQCFVVKAGVGMPITGSYEVIHPDADMISVSVIGPKGNLHYEKKPPSNDEKTDEEEDSSEGFFSFDTEFDGDHTFCIANGDDEKNDGIVRMVAFNFRASADGEQDYQFVGLESELADLKEGLELLKDHQSYMNQREDVHKDTLESINTKVLCWTILEMVILISMAIWQITYIRSFFETKRRI